MSNPIRSLLPTPLSMNFISDINALNQLPLPIFKFLIDCALSIMTNINVSDESLLKSILVRQRVSQSLILPSINSLKSIHSIIVKVLKLMRTSQPDQIQTNLQNLQKYLATVLSENTLLQSTKITYLIEALSLTVHKSIESVPKTIESDLGTIEWSIYNLKKANLNKFQQKNDSNNDELGQSSTQQKTINKMYVKVSFGHNFSPSQVEKYIASGFKSNPDMIIQANLQQSFNASTKGNNSSSRTVVMSLIDFRLFMEEIEKIKNLNY